ncbi:NAD-dependent epimerase/dehydratase family protein [Pelagibacteraceae bacterium]|nr:NAD-dependent epimerase/dehydratase family protein [Pelagibacteraceae bacterium]
MKSSKDIEKLDLNYIVEKIKIELNILANKNILITGGAGFLGFYFVKSIVHWNSKNFKNKINLTVSDNFVRGTPQWLKELSEINEVTLVEHDVTKPIPANINSIDYIIHAASIASPIYYRKYPIQTMDANVVGLRNLLDYSLGLRNDKKISGFLFFSSSEVYGDPVSEKIPTEETYWGNVSFTGPRACYDESKRYGETLCVNFAYQYNLPIKIARPFNNYGPGLKIDDKRVIPDIARNIIENRNVVLYSNGSPTRTFCYIADAIIGYFKILINGKTGEAYNIGIEKPEVSIEELATKIITIARELFNYTGELEFKYNDDINYLKDNPNRRCPSIIKAKNEISFNPEISLEEGLRRSLIWYKENNNL